MAVFTWKGGTPEVKQIETFTLNDDFNDSETSVTMTMTDENGGTETESITPSGVDETVIASAWLVALQGSVKTLFVAVDWTSATNVVTGTAKIAGVPFLAASSITGGAGTRTDSVTTASAGPSDVGLAANYVEAAAPSSGATNIINVMPHPIDEVSYPMLYSLDQSGVDVRDFIVGSAFDADIGQTANGYYLKIDVNQTSAQVVFKGRGNACWLQGTIKSVYVVGGINSKDMLQLKGSVTSLYINGSAVQGKITMADSATLTNVYQIDAPGANLKIGASVTGPALVHMNSGNVVMESVLANSGVVTVNGGIFNAELATWTNNSQIINQDGGLINFNAAGIIPQLNLYSGEWSGANNKTPGVTVSATEQWGGILNVLGNVTLTAEVVRRGGVQVGVSGTSIGWSGTA